MEEPLENKYWHFISTQTKRQKKTTAAWTAVCYRSSTI